MNTEMLEGIDWTGLHERALDEVTALVDRVRPDQLGASTPCEGWDVRTLLAHLIGGNRRWVVLAESGCMPARKAGSNGAPPEAVVNELLGSDPAGAYRTSAEALKEAWRDPGRLEQIYDLPLGRLPGRAALGMHLLETVAHGWDLARATGQEPGIDPEVVGAAWSFARASLSGERPPGSPFAPAVEPTEDASDLDALAAFLGRRA